MIHDSSQPDAQPDRLAKMRAMREAGSPVQAIAAEFNLSATRVYRLLSGSEELSVEEKALRARFPGFPSKLARRLAKRFPDDDLLRAAEDADLLSMRQMTAAHLSALRARLDQRQDEPRSALDSQIEGNPA